MSNFWLKLKVWTKIVLFALVLIYVVVFVAKNSAKSVTPWFWVHEEPQTTLLLLVLYAFLAGVLCTVLISTTLRTINQIQEIKRRGRADRLEREVSDMKTKAAMLRSRPDESAPPADEIE